ncbi:superoxide dismutase [Pseudoruegeria sp. SK021]|nr:superoxide dismutase [Pseudoruegeria sp. SK021]
MFAALVALTITGSMPLSAADFARAEVRDTDGNIVGGVTAETTPSGTVLLTVSLTELPPGIHGAHIHETGDCSASDFSSAGGHVAGDAQHGVDSAEGPHPGDMPNITILEAGATQVEIFSDQLDIDRDILDDDGSAFVLHAGVDDYTSQPSGASGDRIACGEFSAE